MSEGSEATAVRGVDTRIGARGTAVRVAAALFWGYLLVRWLNAWLGGPLFPPDQPLLPVETIRGVAASLNGWTGALAPVGSFLGGIVQFLAVAANYLPAVATGVWLTVVLTVVSIALGLVVAVPLAVARTYGGRLASAAALVYVELIRGTPLLAQLFVLYYGLRLSSFVRELPGVGEGIVPAQAVWVAVVGLTINSAAYQAEYIRSALDSVDPGQLTAARAVGLSKLQGLRYVVLPQGLRFAIPGWSNELVYLIKYSSLAAFITVPELYYLATGIASRTLEYPAMLTLAGLIYLGLVLSASAVTGRVERAVAIPGLGQPGR